MRYRAGQNPWPWTTAAARLLALVGILIGLPRWVQAQDAHAQVLVDQVIEAHGGMSAWTTLKDITFTITSVALTPQGDVAGARIGRYFLKRPDRIRVEVLTGNGLLIQGFDGHHAWVTLDGRPDRTPDALKRAHFQAVNWWYWIGIPFKLTDPGVILQHKGMATVQGQSVAVLDVTFQPGVGYSRDHFTYFIDPATHQIRVVEVQLQPGIWPGVNSPTPSWQGWGDYKAVGPFTMHTKRIQYGNADLTEKRGVAILGDFQLNTGLSDRLFGTPE